MRAMIFAAGLGTRLRPMTNTRPKALMEVAGRTLLDIALSRLRNFGIHEVIVNVHHFADMVVKYLEKNHNFGMHVEISREDPLLDTGGGLQKAAHFFVHEQEPFIVHNVDVLSSVDLGAMVKFHREQKALVTLAVQHRKSSRLLLFDRNGLLCGRLVEGEPRRARVSDEVRPMGFTGIHVIEPRIFSRMNGGAMKSDHIFPIIPVYLRLADEGDKVVAFDADGSYWRDLGTTASLEQAEHDVERGLVSI